MTNHAPTLGILEPLPSGEGQGWGGNLAPVTLAPITQRE
jgi:hypothetical protein